MVKWFFSICFPSADKKLIPTSWQVSAAIRLIPALGLTALLTLLANCDSGAVYDNPEGGSRAGGAGSGASSTGGSPQTSSQGGTSSMGTGGNTAPGTGGQATGGTTAKTGGSTTATGITQNSGGSSAGATAATGGTKNTGGSVATGGTNSTGGSNATGGAKATGGAATTGGSAATGGNKATGGSPSGGGGSASSGSIPMTIPTPKSTEIRDNPTVLPSGVHDLGNLRVGVKSSVGCDGEGQPAVFELADGATLKNVIIAGGVNAGNGIQCKGNCTLDHIYWEDVCEDAATVLKDGAVMKISNSIALNASDKVFQHNAKGGSKTIITNSYIAFFGKVWRSCGDCTGNGGPRYVEMDNVRVEGGTSNVVGVNENYGDVAKIRNLYVKGGYNAATDKPKICQVFTGVTKGSGSSTKLYDGASQFNSKACDISLSDVLSW